MSKRIQAIDVDVFYGKFKAVEGVNIDIAPRSVTAFIGPSGCGKTTFLRSINRMHEVLPGATVDGQLLLDGEDIYGPGVDPVRVRSQIGMVFQRPNPFPTMSIRDNVLAGYKLNGTRLNKSVRTSSWRSPCAAPTCGTRSRTASTSPAPASPAVSSSVCASPAPSRCSPT